LQVALLNAKKQYVRYISHELRTPLNAAFMGLTLLADDLKNRTSPRDVARYENVCDVQLSCSTALDTLNDLLTFEKLESGILTLHKEELNAMEFIAESVNIFKAHAKANRVTLKYQRLQPIPAADGSRDGPLPLERYDTITLDKFKVAQVIRNLISNALKFTPAGGKVTVVASFVPGSCSVRNSLSIRPSESRRIGLLSNGRVTGKPSVIVHFTIGTSH
jgi:signal transduction histidine kinase